MSQLGNLVEFYKREQIGLPHDKADLWELGWWLAEIIEIYKIDEWKGITPSEEKELVLQLRSGPDAALVDTAVNLLHWALLHHSQAEGDSQPGWEEEFKAMGRDVVQYLLTRR